MKLRDSMDALGDKHLNGHKPKQRIEIPPLYSWPPRPVAAVRWLMFDLHFPWGFFFSEVTLGFVRKIGK